MKQLGLWSEPQPEQSRVKPLIEQAETQHHHMELWFYDPRNRPVVMCMLEPDYHTRYSPDEIWSVGFCGGSVTDAGCTICHPVEKSTS